jgi:hypothetical protein
LLLGTVIKQLQDETAALDTLLALDDLALLARTRKTADAQGVSLGECVCDAIGHFVTSADDDAWLAMMTAAARAEDPGSAGLRCMLDYALLRD